QVRSVEESELHVDRRLRAATLLRLELALRDQRRAAARLALVLVRRQEGEAVAVVDESAPGDELLEGGVDAVRLDDDLNRLRVREHLEVVLVVGLPRLRLPAQELRDLRGDRRVTGGDAPLVQRLRRLRTADLHEAAGPEAADDVVLERGPVLRSGVGVGVPDVREV